MSGVSVIATLDDDGRGYAMTVSSVTSVSDQPPSLLVCINQSTQIAPVLTLGRALTINVLSQNHQDVSICCSSGEQSQSRLETGNWQLKDGQVPYLTDAEAVFNCVVDQITPYGTHNVVIAKLLSVRVSDNSVNALVYANAGYHKLTPL